MPMIIAVDFDGTIATHRYPYIGDPVPGAFQWLKKFQGAGAFLILWTMRSDSLLDEAVGFCRQNGLEFWQVNRNSEQESWTKSPKAYAHIYIDDIAVGCPIKDGSVDWEIVGPLVMKAIAG